MTVSICTSCYHVHEGLVRICKKCGSPTNKADAPDMKYFNLTMIK